MNRYVNFVREFLKRNFPQAIPAAVTASAVGCYEKLACAGKPICSHFVPPPANTRNSKLRCVLRDADTHPALVTRKIIDSVGNSFSQLLVHKVMHPNLFWAPLGTPFSTGM